ncbi:unnamed protein product [Symbiodinium sp. CCMP2592]|nr:unnamed protein product [Symbiodinium sp. CCMP2592]
MSSVSLVPRVEQDIKASMDSLQMNFGLDAKVVAEVLGTGIRHLEEFRFLFENEAAIGTWVGKLGLGDATMLQTARLRRAWKATCTYYTQAEQDRSKVALADLDSILADSELRTLKEAFWIRYKLRFPAEVQPSDATVSRISRELSKRMLCIYDVWRVRSLQFQLGTSQKRRKLADGLYTDEPEVDEVVARDVDTYLHKLHTLMIAYALNGVQVIAGVDPAGEKALGANSCQFVEVPLDCVLAYYYRARKAAMQVAPAQRLGWLQHRDAEERAEWVSRFREGTRTLGAVIKEVMEARDAHWLAPALPEAGPVAPKPQPVITEPTKSSLFVSGPMVGGKPTARVMKDGTKLCGDYQKGSCKHSPPCPNGAHRCAVVLRAERVCGAPNHGAAKCKAKAKARRELTPCLVMLHREDITLGRAFRCCGWRVLVADRLTQEADCIWTGLAAPPPFSPDSFEQLLQGCASRGAAVVQEGVPPETGSASSPSAVWLDLWYDSCVFLDVHKHTRLLRHNVAELQQWPSVRCHHRHLPQGSDPLREGSRGLSPVPTACFAFSVAVSMSWWAARCGRAQLRVHRWPLVEPVGRREHWAAVNPRARADWAVEPMAVFLGLRPHDPGIDRLVPLGRAVGEVELHDRSLPPGHVYVGRGHHSHRLPVTKWCSPYTPGHDCSPSEWMHLFVEHIICNYWTSLPDLQGATLVCDCPLGSLCERDVLAGLVWYQLASSRSGGRECRVGRLHPDTGLCRPRYSLFSAGESVITAFRSLFPSSAFRGFVFPFIEDLVNSPPFTLFPQWLREQGLRWDGALGPSLSDPACRLMQRTAEGQQAGALSGRAALPPLLPSGLSPDEHFRQALARGDDPLYTEHPPVLDQDLHFAAAMTVGSLGRLRELRRECVGPLRELKRRWSHVGDHLRKLQTPAVRKVTAQRDLGLLSLFVVLLSWPDTTLPSHLLFGMPAVGTSLPCGVFPQQSFDTIPLHRLFENVDSHNKAVQGSIRPGPHDDFLLEQSTKDFEAGFCSAPLSWSELLRHTKGKPIRLIPRCVISQASGKQRVIDNADHGGQSELSSDSNKLVLCSALRPAQHVSLAMRCASPAVARRLLEEDQWEGGGEDWPDAYRHCPMDEDQSRACVVVWYHKDWAQPAYQVYSGLLFGLPLAVTSFNRLSRFSEAVGRRLVCVLVSMYFDDAHLTDPASAKGSAQFAFSEVNKLLGSPFAEAKRQPMSTVGDFLGLEWDFCDVGRHHVVRFWVRSRLQAKVEGLLLQAEQDNCLPPGLASKLYGMLNFLEQGVYGRIGTGGIGALKERQYETARELTPAIRSSFEVIRAILALRPRRSVEVLPSPCARFVAASDAAEDEPRKGTGGFLLLWPGSEPGREAFVAQVDRHTYDAFLPGEVKIAQLELSMVLFALTARASTFRSRRGTWYIDNVAALMALIRGRSDSPDLERLAHLIHVALFSLQVWVYWEWVPSKSNWSDSISRLGASDPWAASRGFCLHHALFPTEVWSLPLVPAMLVFQFL